MSTLSIHNRLAQGTNNKLHKYASGFSLVELMIALTLGLVITGVVVQIFTSSRSTYDLEEGLSEVQEQGRFAMEYLAGDVRQAGNFGCAKLDNQAVNNIVRNPTGPMGLLVDPYNPNSKKPAGLIVYQYTGTGGTALTDWTPDLPGNGFFDILGAPQPALIPFSDVIVIQYAVPLNVQLFNPGAPTRADLQLVRTPTTQGAFQQNDIVFVSDCSRGDIFQVTNNPAAGAGPSISLSHGASGNTQPLLEHAYDNSADVMKLATRAYFVGVNPAVSPEPSLYRLAQDSNSWRPEPLVEGVEQLKVLMGLEAFTVVEANANMAETYVAPSDMYTKGTTFDPTADRDMSKVVDVKLGMVIRSSKMIDASAAASGQVVAQYVIPIFGNNNQIYRAAPAPAPGAYDPEHYRRRRLFTMSVQKRNK